MTVETTTSSDIRFLSIAMSLFSEDKMFMTMASTFNLLHSQFFMVTYGINEQNLETQYSIVMPTLQIAISVHLKSKFDL
jgi:hypothetical protein